MKLLTLLVALLSGVVASAQTVTIPSQQVVVTIPAQTITLPGSTSTPTPPATNTAWVYTQGTFRWAGAYNFFATVNYADKQGAAPGGFADAAVTITGAYGGWQPFAPGNAFDTRLYKYLVLTVKPTQSGACFATGFAAANDEKDGDPVTFSAGIYGPAPQAGVWASYKIPLSVFALTNPMVFKFSVADCSGKPTNLFYVTDVGFSP